MKSNIFPTRYTEFPRKRRHEWKRIRVLGSVIDDGDQLIEPRLSPLVSIDGLQSVD